MKVLIFGGAGMLGHKLVQRLQGNFDLWTTIHGDLEEFSAFELIEDTKVIPTVDVTDPAAVEQVVSAVKPDVVINAVGVIKQLPSSKDVITTLTINSIFPQWLALLGEKYRFRLVGVSTDCVFAGSKGNYNENDAPDALDLYGRSKQFGEVSGANCITLRTSIIGRELTSAHSLVEWFLSNRGSSVKGFVHAIYSGFPTIVFADIITDLITNHDELTGTYHVSSEPINKFDLLNMINDEFAAGVSIEPETEFRIDRSLDSSRFASATGFKPKAWPEMIKAMADDPTPYEKWRKERV
jgi:dTDP-4-dehydrorhamnose reductase